jgi:hypothetical protein
MGLDAFLKRFLGVSIIGVEDCDGLPSPSYTDNNIILRRKSNADHKALPLHNRNFFLMTSFFDGDIRKNFNNVDILTLKSLFNIKHVLKKYSGKKIGLEILVSHLRSYNNEDLGKWFFSMRWIYELCKRYDFQFILSSGATMPFELLSTNVFNSLLESLCIDRKRYWQDLEDWLDYKKRGIIFDAN